MGEEDPRSAPGGDPLVENTLAIIVESLDHLVPSPKTRELRAKASSFQRALDRWTSTPPTDEQRQALRDLVVELHAAAMALEKRHQSYRSMRVGAQQQSGTHVTGDASKSESETETVRPPLTGARGR